MLETVEVAMMVTLPESDADGTSHVDDDVSAAYSLLLENQQLDLDGLTAALDRDRGYVKSLLARMVELSLMRVGEEQDEAVLLPLRPAAAMRQLIAQEYATLRDREALFESSFEVLSSALDVPAPYRWSAADPGHEQIEGLAAVRRQLERIAAEATWEALSFSPTAREPSAARAASRPLDLDVLRRGVAMRRIYLDSVGYDSGALAYASELLAAGAQFRVAPRLPLRMIIVDRRVAVLPITPGADMTGVVIIRDSGPLAALTALFEAYWHEAKPLTAGTSQPADCSPVEVAILRMLGTGVKDDAAARQLDMSVRTLRRSIADLMRRFDADSRFELGMRAAKRGLL